MKTLKELDEQIMSLRKEKTELEKVLYETNWPDEYMADSLIDKIDEIQRQINRLRKSKERIKRKNYKGDYVANLDRGCHCSSVSLKELMMN